MTNNEQTFKEIKALFDLLICQACNKKAEAVRLEWGGIALCRECHDWIFIEKGEIGPPMAEGLERTVVSRQAYLELKQE